MTISHHPGQDLLLAYAGGATNEAVSLLIATHLALCPACRSEVAAAEAIGGALLSELEPASLSDDALQRTLARLGNISERQIERAGEGRTDFPQPLRSYLSVWNDVVPWRRIFGGLYYRALFRTGKTRAVLIKALPGSGVYMHRHRGEELTLVLAGGFTDSTGHYVRGDVQMTGMDIGHELIADESEPCITLAVTEGRLAFRDWPTAIVGRIFGF